MIHASMLLCVDKLPITLRARWYLYVSLNKLLNKQSGWLQCLFLSYQSLLWMQVIVIAHILHSFYSPRRRHLIGIGIPIKKLRRSSDRLRFIMGILIHLRRCLISEYMPRQSCFTATGTVVTFSWCLSRDSEVCVQNRLTPNHHRRYLFINVSIIHLKRVIWYASNPLQYYRTWTWTWKMFIRQKTNTSRKQCDKWYIQSVLCRETLTKALSAPLA